MVTTAGYGSTGTTGTGTGCHKVNPCPHRTRTAGLRVFTGCHVPGFVLTDCAD